MNEEKVVIPQPKPMTPPLHMGFDINDMVDGDGLLLVGNDLEAGEDEP